MKLWIKFLNAIYRVDEPIGTKDAIKIFLAVAMLSALIAVTLLGYQPISVVF